MRGQANWYCLIIALAVGRRAVQGSPGVLKETMVLFGREPLFSPARKSSWNDERDT